MWRDDLRRLADLLNRPAFNWGRALAWIAVVTAVAVYLSVSSR